MFMEATRDDAANIAAIHTYVMSQPLNTKAAEKARDAWLKFHEDLGWTGREFPSVEDYDNARNLRNAFDLANAKTAAEKKVVEEFHKNGITSEELRGEPKRTTSDGNYLVPPPEPEEEVSEPWIPMKTKIALGVGAAVLVGLSFLKKMYVDPFLPKGK